MDRPPTSGPAEPAAASEPAAAEPDTRADTPADAALGVAWRQDRRHMLDIGFRMLGSVAEAEDVVQEAFARLVRADVGAVDDTRAWLAVVTSRLCLDRLRSRRRHPTDPDDALGDRPPLTPALGPEDRVTLDDDVRLALHLVLERLSAAERTAFVLHDVFQYPFDAVAEAVGRTPAACRQLASRARRTIRDQAGPARFVVEPADQRRVTERFVAACAEGDLGGLLAVLDPDVDGEGDAGGSVGVQVAVGRDAIAPVLLGYLGPRSSATLLTLPGGADPTIAAVRHGRVVAVVTLGLRDGRVVHVSALADPAKLAPYQSALGVSSAGG